MRLFGADRRLGVVRQEEVRPVIEADLLALPDGAQRVVVPRCKPFAQLALGVVPVRRVCRFHSPRTVSIAVPHPPDIALLSLEHNSIVFTRSCHPPPPV